MPVDKIKELTKARDKKDIHEKDYDYLCECRRSLYIAVSYYKSVGFNWERVNCVKENGIRDIEDIFSDVVKIVEKVLREKCS